ncbi:amino acid adenylation domain-containing protein [Streptomyces fradiae]|uniref:amino acid adenylation domain-containing protein n=1 Tax=Streptomyces fradiae TaxID=1906 RepID=UPI0033C00120
MKVGAAVRTVSSAQRRLWFLDQLSRGSADSLLPLALRFRGALDVPALERALAGIVARHEVLRTRFAAVDGEPVPRVDPPGSFTLERVEAAGADELFAAELTRPLDLALEPPLRAVLARTGADEHLLLVVVHHIAVDGWSWDVLLRELAAGYRGEDVAAPPMQYADFARLQGERLSGARMERLLGHWRERLAGVAPLELPTDRPRPRFWDGAGDVVRFDLPAGLVAGVDRLARSHRATRYMVMLAAYQALLARYSGRTDIAVCTTLADRGDPRAADVIGPFVNTIVLRTDLGGDPSFAELLGRVRAGALRDFSHAEAPFDRVVQAVGGARDLSRHPLAQASFTLLGTQRPPRLEGLDVELVAPPLRGTPLDVFLDLGARPDGTVAARLQYSTALFDAATMHRFRDGYAELLRAVVAAPDAPVGETAGRLAPLTGAAGPAAPTAPGRPAPAVAAAGRAEAPGGGPSTAAGNPVTAGGAEPFAAAPDAAASAGDAEPFAVAGDAEPFAVAGDADAVALVCGEESVTYGALDATAGGVAAALAAGGTQPGDPVGVLVRRGPGAVAAMAGVWRAGCVYVPLDAALPEERLRFMVAEAGVRCVLADASTADAAGALGVPVAALESVRPGRPGAGAPRRVPDPRELAYVVFTSGSTGRPKAVGVEHRALAAHVAAAREAFGVTGRDRVLAFSSFTFDASLDQLLPALSRGATVVVRPDEQWHPARLVEEVRRHGLTVVNLPPTYWAELTRSLGPDAAGALASLRLLVLGGEAVPPDVLAAWRARVPHVRVCNAYGPTETTVTATVHDVLPGAPDPRGSVPIGRPLGVRTARVVDGRGEPVAAGEVGELLIGGPELARGYLGRPELTAERFVPDPSGTGGRLYRTGDLVRLRHDGGLEFTGRADDQVKVRGFRVEPGEVEAVLRQCPGVAAAAVAARPDASGALALAGYVVAAPAGAGDGAGTAGPEGARGAGSGAVGEDGAVGEGGAVGPGALRAWCAARLPHYAVPSTFTVLDALPVNAAGKVDRSALPAPGAGDRAAGGPAYVAPRDATERVVAEIWAEVLGVERVGVDDGFFELGGHSLLATMAVSRIAERLGREVELRTLFENPRLREFGPLVGTARRAAGGGGVVPVDRSGPLPMSFAQERMWFLDRMSDRGDEYVLWYAWRVRGGLDRAAWQGALDDVVARHEVLRTALVEVDGRPAQRVRGPVAVPLEWRAAGADAAGAGVAGLEGVRERAAAFATRRFDLAEPPLLRSGVWELAPDDHVAVIAFHHAATDGWSKDVLVGELTACYTARLAGRRAALPDLPVQYGDFAVWQRRAAEDGALDGPLGYWESALAGLAPLELPTDRPRPAAWSGRGAAVEVDLPPALAAGLDELARRHGATRYMVLLAVVQVVLSRWSGQRDVAVGSPVAGRGQLELERLVGLFVNTVVLRGDLSGDPSFAEFLGRVREAVLGAFDHQEVPFERLVERLRPERDASRNPLFQVMFDVQESPVGGVRADGLEVEPFALPWRSAKFDLTATFLLYADRFALNVEYATDLFDAATVSRFAGHVGRVLQAVLADPDRPVGRLEMLSAAEYAELAGPAGAAAPLVAPGEPYAVAGAPDAVALVCGDASLTYGELDGLAGGLARELAGAGAGPEAAVGVCLGRGLWSVAAMAAVWRAGGVYVPLDPRLPEERLRYMVDRAGVGCVVTDAATAPLAARLGARVVSVDAVRPDPDGPRHTPAPHELACVIFTSGSTGRPKAVGVEHHALAAHARTARERFGITAGDRVMNFASFSFDASLEQVLPALGTGAAVVVRPDEVWTVEELAERVRAHGVTVMELTPSYWEEVAARLDTVADDLKGLRLVVTGGETLPSAPLARWFAHLPHVPIQNTYGPTESVISATSRLVTGPVEGRVPIGTAWGARRLYVVDAYGELVPVGVPGELLVGGPELARGYLGQPELTAERFVPDPFGGAGGRLYRTGDIVRRLPGGELDFLGRTDHQVKIRGFRIEPGEVEAVLEAHPGVHAAAVLVREVRGDRALVGYAAGPDLAPGALADWCRSRLPGYMVPAAFVVLDALPRTVQGKLDTAALPDPEPPAAAGTVAPRTPTEVVTAQIWAEVLGLAQVGVEDDFFALGGHSLRAVAVASRLRAAFDCPVRVRDLFEHPTVERLAAEVERRLIEEIAAMSEDEIDLSLTADR